MDKILLKHSSKNRNSYRNENNSTNGFTIIEVLIVLAIAGLILLIMFLAVPALQRNYRNTARKHDAQSIVTAIQECLNNNSLDAAFCAVPTNLPITSSNLAEFTGFHYGATSFGSGVSVPPTVDEPNYLFNLTCNASGSWFLASRNPGSYVVTYKYETGSGYTNVCIGS